MSTLDVIKYISIRHDGVLRIFNLPVAYKEVSPLKVYHYDIMEMGYAPFLRKLVCEARGRNISCTVHTVFGDTYKDSTFSWYAYNLDPDSIEVLRKKNIMQLTCGVKTPIEMVYKNTYLNSIGSDQRFRNMEI